MHRYRSELAALTALFGEERVVRALPRLQEIHDYTEAKWSAYAATLRDGIVRYLLIAEAPPWSPEGRPEYALDPKSDPRTIMKAVRCAFPRCKDLSNDELLDALAQHGFLLMDSIPFAMKYSSSKRANARYDDLIRLTVTSYLHTKIDESGLTWSPDLRIAFSLRLNALSILKARKELPIAGRTYKLTPAMIVAGKTNYPDPVELRRAFNLTT
jgi:hypothetical protein